MTIGDGIKRAREALKWTQADLAQAIHTDQTHVSHWESGRREPSIANAAAVARALGCSVDSLMGRRATFDEGFNAGYLQARKDMQAATQARFLLGAE